MYWVYDLPNWLFAALCVVAFTGFGVVGVLATRSWVRGLHHAEHSHNDVVSYYLAGITVLYGITLGLLAVGAWTNYSDVEGKVDREAGAIAAVYRDAGGFAEPARSALQQDLREYVWRAVCQGWPAQRNGRMISTSGPVLEDMRNRLLGTDLSTPREQIVSSQVFTQLNALIEARQARLESAKERMPPSIWTLVIVGALISISCTWFFDLRNLSMHVWMTVLFAGLLGLMIYLTAALDNPFRGKVSVGPEPIESLYHQTMNMPKLKESSCGTEPPGGFVVPSR